MFTTHRSLRDGLARWAESLPSLFRRPAKRGPVAAAGERRPPPQTEGERALHQAMGWTEDAWRRDDL